jgi:hypothetical protein
MNATLPAPSQDFRTSALLARDTTIGFIVGGGAGLLTMGIAGPGGPLAGAAIGVAPGAIAGVRNISRQRRSRGWMTVRNRIVQQNHP